MNTIPHGLVILGFGGHARSVADVAISLGVKSLYFLDENAQEGERFLSFPVKKALDFSPGSDWAGFPASGDNDRRALQIQWLHKQSLTVATLISASASLGIGSTVSTGCFVGHHAHVGPMAKIGTGSIVNTGAIVEHECIIEEFCHISVGTTVAGRCKVGCHSFIGAGATIIDGIHIVNHVTVGAGGCVTTDLKQSGVYVGVPARKVSH